jgi:hypothetical protein
MLKLIPRENPVPKNKTKKVISARSIQKKLPGEDKMENKMIKSTCIQLIHYVKKAGRQSLQEMGTLIHNLQRSALSLERKRAKLIRERLKKK